MDPGNVKLLLPPRQSRGVSLILLGLRVAHGMPRGSQIASSHLGEARASGDSSGCGSIRVGYGVYWLVKRRRRAN